MGTVGQRPEGTGGREGERFCYARRGALRILQTHLGDLALHGRQSLG